MDLGLKNKRAIVTGGSRGIGYAIANTLIDEGAEIATCARGEEALNDALKGWNDRGGKAYGQAVDVSDQEKFKSWFHASAEQMGGLDILISNVTTINTSQGEARWQHAFEMDLMQHIRTAEMAMPYLKQGNSPSIVFIASIASIMNSNMPTETEYGAMKASLISYAAQLATKVGSDNIRVNLISPGPVYHEGGFWQQVEQKNPELYKRAQAISVFNRLGKAQEIADTAVYLASERASNITAANIRVDGGAIKTVNF